MALKTAEILTEDEGVSKWVYFCPAKQLTVGVGRNIQQIPFSQDEIDLMLKNDIARVEQELTKTFSWFSKLAGARRDAFVCIAFNLGLPRLLRFKKALKSMSLNNWSEASHHFKDSKWYGQVTNRAERYCQMIKTNKY